MIVECGGFEFCDLDCEGKICGDDGCGNLCGVCDEGECVEGVCISELCSVWDICGGCFEVISCLLDGVCEEVEVVMNGNLMDGLIDDYNFYWGVVDESVFYVIKVYNIGEGLLKQIVWMDLVIGF